MAWRDHLAIHPACEMLPAMMLEELLALGNDIRVHGLQEKIKLIRYGVSHAVLDGRSRLDALEMIGPISVYEGTIPNRRFFEVVDLNIDPLAFVISMNVHRRHLTAEQRRELVAKMLKAQPTSSDRSIAAVVKVDHKTVAPIRAHLERRGEIPHHQSRVGKNGVKQPSGKPALRRKSPTSEARSKRLKFGARGPVAPKYRNPENPSETWAGRGLKPRWLAEAIKTGKKLEHFSIAQSAKQTTKRGPKKVRRAKKR